VAERVEGQSPSRHPQDGWAEEKDTREAAPRCWAAIGRRKDGGSVAFFMFGRSFNDLDSHIWEMIWMDPSQVQGERN
jgi:predicted lactoylglutathione lyase